VKTLIESMGVYLPEQHLSSKEVIDGCLVKPAIDLEALTGIKTRPVAGDGEYSFDLAVKAASKCFKISHYVPQDIEMIIAANISRMDGPDFTFSFEPSTAAKLANHFNISNAITFDISCACAGMVCAITLMDSFIKAGFIQRGLVISGEYISYLIGNAQKEMRDPVDPQFASLTLGDSGAALILESTENDDLGFHQLDFFTAAQHCELCIGGPSKEAHGGFSMRTDSAKIHAVATPLCTEHIGLTIKDLSWDQKESFFIIPHQTASRALKAYGKAVNEWFGKKISSDKNMIINLEHRGNSSSTSCFVALWDKILDKTIGSGSDLVFIMGASGLTTGIATYTLDDLPERILAMENISANNIVC